MSLVLKQQLEPGRGFPCCTPRDSHMYPSELCQVGICGFGPEKGQVGLVGISFSNCASKLTKDSKAILKEGEGNKYSI